MKKFMILGIWVLNVRSISYMTLGPLAYQNGEFHSEILYPAVGNLIAEIYPKGFFSGIKAQNLLAISGIYCIFLPWMA